MLLVLSLGCQGSPPASIAGPAPPAEPSSPQFIDREARSAAVIDREARSAAVMDASFSEVYQLFLKRYLAPKLKIARWTRSYQRRWIRWSGQLVAVTATGLKMRQLKPTMTFDVSIQIVQPQLGQLKHVLTVGKFYTYVARLDSYDDLFRTLNLDQGIVVNPTADGVPGELAPLPPPLPRIGYEDEPPGTAPWLPTDPPTPQAPGRPPGPTKPPLASPDASSPD